jgi:hypothetical protein
LCWQAGPQGRGDLTLETIFWAPYARYTFTKPKTQQHSFKTIILTLKILVMR